MNTLKVLLIFIFTGLTFSCSVPSETRPAATLPDGILDNRARASDGADDYGLILSMYGRPERDDTTAYDKPRPPIPTRFVEYHPEDVKIAFVPVAGAGQPPPYKAWQVIGYLDTRTNTKMSKSEAAERLRGRLRR